MENELDEGFELEDDEAALAAMSDEDELTNEEFDEMLNKPLGAVEMRNVLDDLICKCEEECADWLRFGTSRSEMEEKDCFRTLRVLLALQK